MPVPSLGAELLGGPGVRANGLPKRTTQADRIGERPPHEPNQQRAGSSRRPFLALLSRLRRGPQPPSARPAAEECRWGGSGAATVGRVDVYCGTLVSRCSMILPSQAAVTAGEGRFGGSSIDTLRALMGGPVQQLVNRRATASAD